MLKHWACLEVSLRDEGPPGKDDFYLVPITGFGVRILL
jgi:hypothetical protein